MGCGASTAAGQAGHSSQSKPAAAAATTTTTTTTAVASAAAAASRAVASTPGLLGSPNPPDVLVGGPSALDALLKQAESSGGGSGSGDGGADGRADDGGGGGSEAAVQQLEALEGEACGLVDHVAKAMAKWAPHVAADAADEAVDIQALKFEGRSVAESRFLAFSAMGRAAVGGVAAALQALPFGAPLGALLGAVYAQAERTARTSANVARLLARVKSVDAQLAEVLAAAAADPAALERVLQAQLRSKLRALGRAVARAGQLLGAYCGKGFLRRMLTAGGDQQTFKELDRTLQDSLMDLVAALNMADLAARIRAATAAASTPSPGDYTAEGQALAEALCAEAGPAAGGDASRALDLLARSDPARLHSLACAHLAKGPVGLQLVGAGLRELGVRVEVLEEKVAQLQDVFKGTLAELEQLRRELAHQPPAELKKKLKEWWQANNWRLKPSVSAYDFAQALLKYLEADGKASLLREYDTALTDEGLDASAIALDVPGGSGFLKVVVHLTDDNGDGKVSQNELLALQLKGDKFAKALDVQAPQDWPTLLDVICMGFDRAWLLGTAGSTAQPPGAPTANNVAVLSTTPTTAASAGVGGRALAELNQALQVQDIISSYNITELLGAYVSGTREWLYGEVEGWLEAATTPAALRGEQVATAAAAGASRLFLLLAGPGMGKSVFSAVVYNNLTARTRRDTHVLARHFFKVGQPRAQGTAMVFSLAAQLAARLPGLAELLLPVAKQHGTGAELQLEDVFDNFLLEPLTQLAAQAGNAALPPILLLLDALDEADQGGQGWLPVAQLVANKFAKLPPCVKVIVTSRPHTSVVFKAWGSPRVIEPEAAQNMGDMRKLLAVRLASSERVAPADLGAAVDILQNKSQGQLIYAKFALEFLAFKRDGMWSAQELGACLPQGLYGAYELGMRVLVSRLHVERPALVRLLRHTLLPVLVSMSEPLSMDQVAWACGVWPKSWAALGREEPPPVLEQGAPATWSEDDVTLMLRLLTNLFPLRQAHAHEVAVLSAGAAAEGGGGQSTPEVQLVYPYHKSVLDWLTGDGSKATHEFQVDVEGGHALLAHRCAAYCIQAVTMPEHPWLQAPPTASNTHPPTTGQVQEPNTYALRHLMSHMAAAPQPTAMLAQHLLHNYAFIEAVFRQGVSYAFVRDLGAHTRHAAATEESRDLCRWLQLFRNELLENPSQVLTTALKCPIKTKVFRHAQAMATTKPPPYRQLPTIAAMDWWQWPALLEVLKGHTEQVQSVTFSPDGTKLASGSKDATVRVWDMGSTQVLATLHGHTEEVSSVAFSPDGTKLASGSNDMTVRVWDMGSAQVLATLHGHNGWVTTVAFSPDGTKLASGSNDRTVHVWDVGSAQVQATLHGHINEVRSVAFSPDGTKLASGSKDARVRVWDVGSAQVQATLHGHTEEVSSVAFSPDGTKLASGSRDNTVRVWDVGSAQVLATLHGHTREVRNVAFSPDGTKLASSSLDNWVRVWDVGTTHVQATLKGHMGGVLSVAFSPDGTKLASGSSDCTVRVWDVAKAQGLATEQGHNHPVWSVAFSPDGTKMASSSSDCTVRVWDVGSAHVLATLQGHRGWVMSVAFSHDGTRLASGGQDKTVRVWDVGSAQVLATLESHLGWVTTLAFSPDGTKLASGSLDKTVCLWGVGSAQVLAILEGHTEEVSSVAFSPDGTKLASGSKDATVRVWDVGSTQVQTTLQHTNEVRSVAFSPNGTKLASGSADTTVCMWDVGSAQVQATLHGHTEEVSSVAFSPDGTKLASGSGDATVRVWDVGSTHALATLQGHTSWVTTVAFSPDGTKLASGGGDATVRVWDAGNA